MIASSTCCGVTSRRRARRTHSRRCCPGCAGRSATTASRRGHRDISCAWRAARWTRCASRSWCGSGSGASQQPEVALGVFDEALGLWRGSPYAEFASEEFVAAEVVRLVELRARAIEERSAALLELGRPGEVIGELEAEIAVEPFRERLRALLMSRSRAPEGRSKRYAPMTRFDDSWPTRSASSPHPSCRNSMTTSSVNTPTSGGRHRPPRRRAQSTCRRGRSLSCSPMWRVRRACGRTIPKRRATRWRATTGCYATRSHPTLVSSSRPRAMGSMPCSRPRTTRSRLRSPHKGRSSPATGTSPSRYASGLGSIPARPRFATAITTAAR